MIVRRWLALFAATGVALLWLYPDSYQQDAGNHYLAARFAWVHPQLFVGVWTRPLFTFLYSFPAAVGYPAAKLLTLVICLLTAYHTYRLAGQVGLARAPLSVPLLFLQPSFFLLSADTMTEPLFALVFVIALRLHTAGRVFAGMVVASLLVLARPEGAFVCALWGVWVLADRRETRAWWRRVPGTLWLATGAATWWLAAFALTGDPWFIRHDWPTQWDFSSAVYGAGPVWTYVARLPEIAGPLLGILFLLGLGRSLAERRLGTLTSAFLTLFVVHSILRTGGWLGSAGYARYLLCVAPATALLTVAGWNDAARALDRLLRSRPARVSHAVRVSLASATLGLSAIACVLYVDLAGFYGRDARAVSEMHAWFRAHPRPITRVIWSQAYMGIVFDRDPWENAAFSGNKAADLETLRRSPAGTLVFWDGDTGPSWWGLTAPDFDAAGYEPLRSQTYALDGWLQESRWLSKWKPRPQEMHLYYKSSAMGTHE